jgi:hypothetical protein
MISVSSDFHVYRAADGTWVYIGSGAILRHPSKTAPNILLIPEKRQYLGSSSNRDEREGQVR